MMQVVTVRHKPCRSHDIEIDQVSALFYCMSCETHFTRDGPDVDYSYNMSDTTGETNKYLREPKKRNCANCNHPRGCHEDGLGCTVRIRKANLNHNYVELNKYSTQVVCMCDKFEGAKE